MSKDLKTTAFLNALISNLLFLAYATNCDLHQKTYLNYALKMLNPGKR